MPSSHCASHKLAVNVNVAEREIVYVLDDVGLGDTFKVTIGKADAFDRRVLEAAKIQRILRLVSREIADVYVAHDRSKFTIRPFFIEEIDRQSSHGNFSDLNVADVYVL